MLFNSIEALELFLLPLLLWCHRFISYFPWTLDVEERMDT